MNGCLKDLSYNTQSKLLNKTIFYLTENENLIKLEENDRNKIISIEKNLNYNFFINLIGISSIYTFLNFFCLKKIKLNFLRKLSDLSFISLFSFLAANNGYKINIINNEKKIKDLRFRHSLIIKNTIFFLNTKKDFSFNRFDIHTKYDYFFLNYLFLVFLRLFL